MYTLRVFTDTSNIERNHFNLGNFYAIQSPSEKDIELGIKMRIVSEYEKGIGIAIAGDQHAFIMTAGGETFETLNKPSHQKIERLNFKLIMGHIEDICQHSLSKKTYESWMKISEELRSNHS